MDITKTSTLERVARVLAARRRSSNADGAEPFAAPDVDAAWTDHREDALAVLEMLGEPDESLAEPDGPAGWAKMVGVALSDMLPHVRTVHEVDSETGNGPA